MLLERETCTYTYMTHEIHMYGLIAGRPKIQSLLRTNANGGEFIWPGDGLWSGGAVHSPSAEGHVQALPVPKRRNISAVEAQLRVAGWERRCRQLGNNERRDAEVEDAGAKPEAAKSIPPNGHDGTRSLETTKRLAWTLCQHFACLAFRAFSSSVRVFFFFFFLTHCLFSAMFALLFVKIREIIIIKS